ARVIMTGVTLGVFDALGDRACTAEELAGPLALDPAALGLLLRALVLADYLEQREEAFCLSPLARSNEFKAFARWNQFQWKCFEDLDRFVRTGRGVEIHRTLVENTLWSDYQRAMFEFARFDARTLVPLVPVP